MRQLVLLSVIVITLVSCSSKKKTISDRQAHRNNKTIQKANRDAIANYVPYTALQYIDRFKAIAVKEMNQFGIPASITLAQGLHESGSGNSELAKVANNHFGIKCTSDWKGQGYYKDDDQSNDCFRVYKNPEESFRDHSVFLQKKRYAALFELDKNDYEGWAYGLKAAGYATNPKYPQLLINTIKKYELDRFDRPETEEQKIKREDRVLAKINNNIGKEARDSVVNTIPAEKMHTVQHGDTLYNISRRFNITVDELKTLNNMADNNIKIGQKLIIAQ
ncbi:hemagglutinin [Mucilaginibacter hurinus]|uniref:Peptidoglycan hydrolase n=1 Tax=Mucilaginibacter hurinus TaxID=2201324 RepID=A0A367GMM1_9SPHI|nr:glucosaminidase domain-containing protein [Mucilaginibacter hurinus]RCH54732.1 hemagglutinin [Mucilaginibacter hurinus]